MKTKNPFVAGLLNVFLPGLGGVYIGNWKAAIFNFLNAAFFIVVMILANGWLIRSEPPWPSFICPGLTVLLYIGVAFQDGYHTCFLRNKKMLTEQYLREGKL